MCERSLCAPSETRDFFYECGEGNEPGSSGFKFNALLFALSMRYIYVLTLFPARIEKKNIEIRIINY